MPYNVSRFRALLGRQKLRNVPPGPSLRSIGTPSSSTGAASPGAPAGYTDSDYLTLHISTANQAPAVDPVWDLIATSGRGTPGGSNGVAFRTYGARGADVRAAPGAFTVGDSGSRTQAVVCAWRDVYIGGSPLVGAATGINGGSANVANLTSPTTTVGKCRIIYTIAIYGGSSGPRFTEENASLDAIREHYDNFTSDGVGGGLGVWSGTKLTAGPGGTGVTHINTANAVWAGGGFALRGV